MMKRMLFLVFVACFIIQCSPNVFLVNTTAEQIDLNSSYLVDTDTDSLIAPYRNIVKAEMDKVIGYCSKTITKQKPESTLGNWMADLCLIQAKKEIPVRTDLAILNYGGVRASNVPKGPVTAGKIFELMPFDNVLVVVAMNGKTLKVLVDKMASEGGWPQSFTLRYAIENRKAVDILLHGKEIDDGKIYFVAMPDYIANGGGRNEYLKELERYENGILVRDAILNHVIEMDKEGKKISAELDGRVTLKERNID